MLIHFEIADNFLHILNQTQDELIHQIRLLAALQLFKLHQLSWGQAAELAGMAKERFLLELDKYQLALIDYDATELTEELKRFQ